MNFKDNISRNDLSINFKLEGRRKVVGDIWCLGFSNTEVEEMSNKELLRLHHPSLNEELYNKIISLFYKTNNMLNVNGIRLLKLKKRDYKSLNYKAYSERSLDNPSVWRLSIYYDLVEPTSSKTLLCLNQIWEWFL